MDTLSVYLNKSILFFPYYKKKKFPVLNDVKLISDYLKYQMQYRKTIRGALIYLVKIHAKQIIRKVKKNARGIRKLYFFRKFIKKKLRKHFLKKINLFLSYGKRKNKKKIKSAYFKFRKKKMKNIFKKK
jgi:hypothetical protein